MHSTVRGKIFAGNNLAVPRHSRISHHPRGEPRTVRYVWGERASYSTRNASQRGRERSSATQSLHRTSKKESKYEKLFLKSNLHSTYPSL